MRIISANLNGIRSATSKGFLTWLASQNADIVALQELKAQSDNLSDAMRTPEGLRGWFHYAEKKGYSGVGLYCRREPDQGTRSMPDMHPRRNFPQRGVFGTLGFGGGRGSSCSLRLL